MKLVKVYSAAGLLEADMVKASLEAQDITVILSQESVGRTMGLSAGRLGKVEVMVPEAEATQAKEFLAAIANGEYEDYEYRDDSENTHPPDSAA